MEEQKAFYTDSDGIERCDIEIALSELLRDGVVFANERNYCREKNGKSEGSTIVLFVICNDIFVWGCADAEDLPIEEVGNLYKMHKADDLWGVAKWCCHRRIEKPQPPVEKMMRKDGSWDAAMENLPENQFEKFCREEKAKKNETNN